MTFYEDLVKSMYYYTQWKIFPQAKHQYNADQIFEKSSL